jgi:uncharacterized protein YnzC (UPF0291/DUF896 family)
MPKPLTKAQQEAQDRDRYRRQFLAMAAAARRAHEPWVEWIDAGCPELTPEQYRATLPRSARGRRAAPAGAIS